MQLDLRFLLLFYFSLSLLLFGALVYELLFHMLGHLVFARFLLLFLDLLLVLLFFVS